MSNPFGNTQALGGTQAEATRITAFLQRVYGWMCVGLAITAAVSLFVASSPAILEVLYGNAIVKWGLFIVTLGMVWYLSAKVAELEPATAGLLFCVYSALNGALFSFIFIVYTSGSIASTFLTASAMFGALALYGTITKRNLAGMGQFAFMGLIGVVIASIVGIFWQNNMFQFVLAVCGVVVFTALTMWDAQKLKAMALALPDGKTGSYAIVGALTLYLDFINLFLFLLRLFGRRR